MSTSPPTDRSALVRAPPTVSSTVPGEPFGYWRRMKSLSVCESVVFQPIAYEPMVRESGIAYSMIEVGSKAVWFVLSSA